LGGCDVDGSFQEFAFVEDGARSDQDDQVWCVDRERSRDSSSLRRPLNSQHSVTARISSIG
jgi:hypothetical protein